MKLSSMLHIALWIFSMSSRKDGSSNEEILQQEFDPNYLVSWSMLRASWISISHIFKDPSIKNGWWDRTSSSSFFLIWSTSWISSGDGEVDIGSSLSATRYSSSCLWERCITATFSNWYLCHQHRVVRTHQYVLLHFSRIH